MTAVFQRRISAASLACATIFGAMRSASAAPLEWKASEGGNGHSYQFVESFVPTLTWDQARLAAAKQTLNGVPGHLATVTSPGEQAFLVALEPPTLSYFLGGMQAAGATSPEQGWSWPVTGEAWDYTAWATNPVEPDDFGVGSVVGEVGHEQHLEMLPRANSGGWNDTNGNLGRTFGYVVEFDVPEPSSVVLLTLPAFAMLRRRRR